MGTIKPGIILSNKPLIEAIFEIRWRIRSSVPQRLVDPHYKLLIGGFYERVKDLYRFHEPLPQSTMPDEIANHLVQHRFRFAENDWPLIQLGPGILTLNDTSKYVWADFNEQICNIIDLLFEIHPNTQNLDVQNVLLRYIDADEFDYSENIFDHLREQMKININLEEDLFESTAVNKLPIGFDSRFTFSCDKPKGTFQVRYASGKKDAKKAIVWETQINSSDLDAPKNAEEIKGWANLAHDLAHDWFFKIIEGPLEEKFK